MKNTKTLTVTIIAIILLVMAGMICKTELTTFVRSTYTRVQFDSSQGNKLTPQGYAPEVVGPLPEQDSSGAAQGDS